MAVKLEPLADRLVVKPIEREEVTKGGIVLPDTAKERPQEGEVVVVAASREFKVLARNPLGEGSRSTPAVAGGSMYLRSYSHLMRLDGPDEGATAAD